ncbi:hypothetical protein CO083_02595 [Candidatus Roizmanbacteria bacterium CG_4_9_14_0_8_um_filter_34_12]|uniref:Nucleotidyl transferase AbiEii/AbiGii toxin family protein n=3 Tax=Candidatus Roizmaniibacteriota TaxID=1752723 RepID=A0A2M7LQ31_9BACT|nr:MAG: hypothetical protein COZ39_04795 [Candidatus Roizmanbacteria bacterium CG_4_10_14_3_um_filter_33_21]PJB88289.1 MAG: hypothetical protein CO083_02595 [Candidatus Roizmanbacteria bacterium CG_4_9_14_0_8_um_filter_34_12]
MLNIKLHRQVMFEIITDIYRSPIANLLGFKGGTMAYFFYGLDRFSTDLDFDLLDENKIEEIKKVIPKILIKNGQLKEESDKRFTLFYLVNYQKENQNIKIEISKRTQYKYDYVIENFYGTDVKILNQSDAFATKLLACTTRNRLANRDFYDAYFYLKKGIIPNEKIIESSINKNLSSYLKFLVEFIEKNISSKTILHGLGELIDEKQKVWIKNNLKKELINRLDYLISETLHIK